MPPRKTSRTKAGEAGPKTAPATEEETCAFPGCKDPPLAGDDFCAVHVFIFPVVESAQKTIRKGGLENVLKGALAGLSASLGESLLQAGKLAIGRYSAQGGSASVPFPGFRPPQQQPQRPPQRPQPPRPTQKNPFIVLGLQETATVDEIRARQRQFATLYHADRLGNDPELAKLAEQKLKEINEAATTAIKNKQSRRP